MRNQLDCDIVMINRRPTGARGRTEKLEVCCGTATPFRPQTCRAIIEAPHLTRTHKRAQHTHAHAAQMALFYRSVTSMSEWSSIEGNLDSCRILLSECARFLSLTKMMTWLNSRMSMRSVSLRVFWFSSSLT